MGRDHRELRPVTAAALGMAAILVGSWTVVLDRDQDIGAPYAQCDGMGENDEWTYIADGTGSLEVSNPRPTCMGMVARAAVKWTGKGRAPVITVELLTPDGGTSVRQVITTKQQRPTWVRLCYENLSLYATGTYTFRVTSTGPVRFGALVMQKEFDNQGCGWWPSQLGSWGL